MSAGEIILYATENGQATIQLRAVDGMAWLSLSQMATLFDRDKSVISRHIKSVLEAGELQEDAVVANHATTAADGKTYQVDHYRLDMVLAVGFKVRSPRGVQFRRWAGTVLKDYLVKGFAIDDAKLKDTRADYFDELIERIRDIRASDARFYQKLRDILSLSVDYAKGEAHVQTFYATVQNKMLHAVTGHTAAELIVARADAGKPNMGLTAWKGGRVRKEDVATAKNYLGEGELSELNLIVTMFLDTADLRARRRQGIVLAEWETILDGFIRSNELPLLRDLGQVSAAHAEKVAHDHYAAFDQRRRAEEKAADEAVPEIDELKRIADTVGKTGPKETRK